MAHTKSIGILACDKLSGIKSKYYTGIVEGIESWLNESSLDHYVVPLGGVSNEFENMEITIMNNIEALICALSFIYLNN